MMTTVNSQPQYEEVQRRNLAETIFLAFNLKKYAISFSDTKLRGHLDDFLANFCLLLKEG